MQPPTEEHIDHTIDDVEASMPKLHHNLLIDSSNSDSSSPQKDSMHVAESTKSPLSVKDMAQKFSGSSGVETPEAAIARTKQMRNEQVGRLGVNNMLQSVHALKLREEHDYNIHEKVFSSSLVQSSHFCCLFCVCVCTLFLS